MKLREHYPSFEVEWRARTRLLERCPSRGLIPILAEFRTARCLSSWADLLIAVDHLIDDHSAVDATPGMNHRGRTGFYDEAIVNDCEPIASLAIHQIISSQEGAYRILNRVDHYAVL